MKRLFLIVAISALMFPSLVQAEIITEEVSYTSGDTTLEGFLAYDDSIEGKRPGVIVVHEWWGHNAYVRKRAKQLAEMGYTAIAIDMYGEGKVADHPEDAGAFAKEATSNMGVAKARFMAGLNVLNNHPTVDTEKTAAIGYCFGGATVLTMAKLGVDLDAVASFHGSLSTDVKAVDGDVKAKILIAHGADDNFISQESIDSFTADLDAAGVDYTFKAYEGAKHSFTNPDADKFAEKFGMGVAYNEQADKQSWQDMAELFDSVF